MTLPSALFAETMVCGCFSHDGPRVHRRCRLWQDPHAHGIAVSASGGCSSPKRTESPGSHLHAWISQALGRAPWDASEPEGQDRVHDHRQLRMASIPTLAFARFSLRFCEHPTE